MTFLNSKSSTDEQPAYRLIWTKPNGESRLSELLDRDEALRQFDNVKEIRRGCGPHSGARLRVVAEAERLAALQRLAEAVLAS